MSEQLTDWFPGSVKPARVGVYERDYNAVVPGDDRRSFCRWDGLMWSTDASGPIDPVGRASGRNDKSSYQDLPWRGLASAPAAPAKRKPREWLRWAAAVPANGVLLCDNRHDARELARELRGQAIRVRITEVL